MGNRATSLITRAEVERVLDISNAIAAVEAAFRAYGEGRAQLPPKPYLHFDKGDLRAMPGYVPDLGLASVKNVNVHPENSDLPVVMATVTVFDPETGFPLAIMDGTYLTGMRTGAAGGVAAKYLARPDSSVVGLVGAGTQATTQLSALGCVLESIEQVNIFDVDEGKAEKFVEGSSAEHGLDVAVADSVEEVVRTADVLVTTTPVREPIIRREWVRPGTHINAIGADAPGKQELSPAILKDARVVVDSREQASHGGEINVALSEKLITEDNIYADIGEIVAGKKAGREDADQVTVFDSTGLAIQDLACAVRVYRQLTEETGELRTFDFLGSW
jgi:alanine dehydrogenase